MLPLMEPCYAPKSNYISLDREVANMTVRGCSARVIMHSASFFSIPTKLEANAGRRCMLSLSIIFTPTKKSNICDFSCTFKFEEFTGTTYGRVPPIVRSHHFLSLEKDTNFLADFGEKLKEEPCNLGEDWEAKGYGDLFSIMGDASNKDRYAWGTGHGTSEFSVKAEGYLGKPAGVVETLSLCVLLDYRDAAPPTLLTSVSARVGVEKKGKTAKSQMVTRFALGRNHARYSDRYLPAFEMSGGPKLAMLDGDRLGARSSRLPCLVGASFQPPPRASMEASLHPDTRQGAGPIDVGNNPSSADAAEESDRLDLTKGKPIDSKPVAPRHTEPTLSTRPSSQLEPVVGMPAQVVNSETVHQVNTSARWPRMDPMIFINAFIADMSPEELAAYRTAGDPAQYLKELLQARFGDDLPRFYGCEWRDFDRGVEERAYRDGLLKRVGSHEDVEGAAKAARRDETVTIRPRDAPASNADAGGMDSVEDTPKRPLSDAEREMQAEAYLIRLITYWTRKRMLESLREVFDVEPQAGLRRLEQHALSTHGRNWREHLSTEYRFRWSDMLLRLENFAKIREGPKEHWPHLVQRVSQFLDEAPPSPALIGDAGVDEFLHWVTVALIRENRHDLAGRIFDRDARRGLDELRLYIAETSGLGWKLIPLSYQFDWEDVALRLMYLAEKRQLPEENWPSILTEIMELAARSQVPFPVFGDGQTAHEGYERPIEAELKKEKTTNPPTDAPASGSRGSAPTNQAKDSPQRRLFAQNGVSAAEDYLSRLIEGWTRERSLDSLRQVFDVEPQAGLRRLEQHALSAHGPEWRQRLWTEGRFEWSDMLLCLEDFAKIRKRPQKEWTPLVRMVSECLENASTSSGQTIDERIDRSLQHVLQTAALGREDSLPGKPERKSVHFDRKRLQIASL